MQGTPDLAGVSRRDTGPGRLDQRGGVGEELIDQLGHDRSVPAHAVDESLHDPFVEQTWRGRVRLPTPRGALERRHQVLDPDRFHDVVVHAGRQEPLAIALHRLGGHRDDPRPLAGPPAFEDAARGLDAVHLRHLHVAEQQVVRLPFERLDRLDAVAGDVGAVAQLLQHPQRQGLVHGVVLGQQDPERMLRAEFRIDRARRRAFRPVGRRRHRAPRPAPPGAATP